MKGIDIFFTLISDISGKHSCREGILGTKTLKCACELCVYSSATSCPIKAPAMQIVQSGTSVDVH